MVSRTVVGIAVGVAGIFVGYCFYFDQKRRSDPDFKKKLRERKLLEINLMDLFFSFLFHILSVSKNDDIQQA